MSEIDSVLMPVFVSVDVALESIRDDIAVDSSPVLVRFLLGFESSMSAVIPLIVDTVLSTISDVGVWKVRNNFSINSRFPWYLRSALAVASSILNLVSSSSFRSILAVDASNSLS